MVYVMSLILFDLCNYNLSITFHITYMFCCKTLNALRGVILEIQQILRHKSYEMSHQSQIVIQTFIYNVVEVELITLIATPFCKTFVIKLVVTLAFSLSKTSAFDCINNLFICLSIFHNSQS